MEHLPENTPQPEPEKLSWKDKLKIAGALGSIAVVMAGHLYFFEDSGNGTPTRYGADPEWRDGKREQVMEVIDTLGSAVDNVIDSGAEVLRTAPDKDGNATDFIISEELVPKADRVHGTEMPEPLEPQPEMPGLGQGK